MADKPKLTQDALSGTVTGTFVDPGSGDEFEVTFDQLTEEREDEITELEKRAKGEDDYDQDPEAMNTLLKRVINDFCHNDVQYDGMGAASRQAMLVAFLRAHGDNHATQEAQSFFETALEGNQ